MRVCVFMYAVVRQIIDKKETEKDTNKSACVSYMTYNHQELTVVKIVRGCGGENPILSSRNVMGA